MTLIFVLEFASLNKGTARTARNRLLCIASQVFLKNGEKRKLWIKALKRENKDKTAWLPRNSDRVCSIHFIDGIPTAANPVPTLHLGYEKEVPKSRRELFRQPLQKIRKAEKNQQTLIVTTENCSNDEINIDCGCENTSSIIVTELSYCKLENVFGMYW